jgi:hypothetical protein
MAHKYNDELIGVEDVKGEFWVLADGSILDTGRHRNPMEALKISWDEWLGSGAIRGRVDGDALNMEKLSGLSINNIQIETILAIVRHGIDAGIVEFYISSTAKNSTVDVDFKYIELDDSSRIFLKGIRNALKTIQ